MRLHFLVISAIAGLSTASPLAAQWVTFTDQTSTRISAAPSVSTADFSEKDYAVGDLDRDGDIDLICVRKWPMSCPGGRAAVLFMNENGVLTDRTDPFAVAANVPASQGFLDSANTTDVVVIDVDGDGWLDVVTATTLSDGTPKYLGHPRVYRNLGETAGTWQGLRLEDSRIPQLLSKMGIAANPRFNAVAAGDVTGDGYVDLYFADSDRGEVGPSESTANDMDNKLLVNMGAANPGVFADGSLASMGAIFNYPGGGNHNYLWSHFGGSCAIADMNQDGLNDVVKLLTLSPGAAYDHTAIMRNNPANIGTFDGYTIISDITELYCSVGDLNNDGQADLVITEDITDRYLLNTGTPATWPPTFTTLNVASQPPLVTEQGFGSQSVIADLDNDGWNDVLIADVDLLSDGCNRRSRIYHNLGDAPNVTLLEESPSVIPLNMLSGVYDYAVFDINGDGWNDLVIGRCSSTGSNCGGAPAGSTQVWINMPPVCACPGDMNFDHQRDAADIARFIDCYLGGLGPCICADMNLSGQSLDSVDIEIFVYGLVNELPCSQ